jgi:hypothetical protein
MSQMRKDVFTGRWVIVAEADAVQPSDFRFKPFTRDAAFCPFCETNEASTPAEVFAIRRPGSRANQPGWSVRVVPNSQPRLRVEGELGRRGEGFHDLMNGVGAHEIIAETPRHDRSLHELEPPPPAPHRPTPLRGLGNPLTRSGAHAATLGSRRSLNGLGRSSASGLCGRTAHGSDGFVESVTFDSRCAVISGHRLILLVALNFRFGVGALDSRV